MYFGSVSAINCRIAIFRSICHRVWHKGNAMTKLFRARFRGRSAQEACAHGAAAALRLKVAPDGRFVIPARRAGRMADIGENGEVTAYLQDGELRIISYFTALKTRRHL